MKNKTKLILLLLLLIYTVTNANQVVSAKELKAKSVPSSFYVDTSLGETPVLNLVEAFEVNGKKYYSLEEVAYALRDTKSLVSVTINKNKATVTLGKQQKKNNSILNAATGKTSKVSNAQVIVDGEETERVAYLIKGKVCMTMEDITVIYNVLLANGGVNRMKLYAGIQNPENVPSSEKGQITSNWEEGLYGIQLTYAPEYMATISYGSIEYGASIVCGHYSEEPEAKQLFVLRKTREWNGHQLYALENINSYMLMTAYVSDRSDNIWQSDNRGFKYEFIFEPGKNGGTLINIDRIYKLYMGTWNNAKKIGTGFNSTKTETSFNIIRY